MKENNIIRKLTVYFLHSCQSIIVFFYIYRSTPSANVQQPLRKPTKCIQDAHKHTELQRRQYLIFPIVACTLKILKDNGGSCFKIFATVLKSFIIYLCAVLQFSMICFNSFQESYVAVVVFTPFFRIQELLKTFKRRLITAVINLAATIA